jgi:hypothetical protein
MSQKHYGLYYDQAVPGQVQGTEKEKVRTLKNSALSSPQIITVTPSAAGTAAATYRLIFDVPGKTTDQSSVTAAFTASHSVAQITSALASAINYNETLFQLGVATSTANVVSIAGRSGVSNYANGATASGGTITLAIANASFMESSPIGFGLFVAPNASDSYNEARLPDTTNSKIVGVTKTVSDIEKIGIYQNAKAAFHPNEVMDVVSDTLGNEGMWMRCVETDISHTDTIYASAAAATRGWVTRTPGANSVAVANKAKVMKPSQINRDGSAVVLVELRF